MLYQYRMERNQVQIDDPKNTTSTKSGSSNGNLLKKDEKGLYLETIRTNILTVF
jgi:hypothetical protein